MLVFEERGKPEYPENKLLEQSRVFFCFESNWPKKGNALLERKS